jgi:hypothetical protein
MKTYVGWRRYGSKHFQPSHQIQERAPAILSTGNEFVTRPALSLNAVAGDVKLRLPLFSLVSYKRGTLTEHRQVLVTKTATGVWFLFRFHLHY